MTWPPLFLPALVALAAPAPWGLLGVAVAWSRAGPAGRLGVFLLALAAAVSAAARGPGTGADTASPPGTTAPGSAEGVVALEAARGPSPLAPSSSRPSSLAPSSPPSRVAAVRLHGTWRHAPDARHATLDLGHRRVPIELQGDLLPPRPGTPLEVLARVRDDGRLLAVDLRVRGPPTSVWPETWREVVRGRLRALLSSDHVGLCEALVLGRRRDLHFEIRDRSRRTGTLHLLVLSGLHVGILSGFLGSVAGGLVRRPGWLCGALLVGFVGLTGGRPPLVRALLGWMLDRVGTACGRRPDGWTRLGACALLMLGWDPALASSLSFQLSFLAVAGMVAVGRLGQRVGAAWLAPAGAFLGTAPLSALEFGEVQPWGVLWTPLLAPFVALLLGVAAVAALPGPWTATLDPATGPLLAWAASGFDRVLEVLARWSPDPLRPAALPVPGVVVSLLLVAALVRLARDQGASHWEAWLP